MEQGTAIPLGGENRFIVKLLNGNWRRRSFAWPLRL